MEKPSNEAEKQQAAQNKQKLFGLLMLEAGVEFAFLIGAPLIGFIFLGRWLDTRFNHHFFVLIGILLAIPLSGFMIYARTKEYQKLLKK